MAIRHLLRVGALCGVLALGACAADPNTELSATGASLSTALVAADGYFKLPRCGTEKTGQACNKPAVVKTVRTALDGATAAFVSAVQLKTDVSIANAQAQISTLTAATPVN